MSTENELESLRAHNVELLADLKKAKAEAKQALEQVAALTGERDEMRAHIRTVKLDEPLRETFHRVSGNDVLGDALLTEARKLYDFDLAADNRITITTKDGKPAQIDDGGKGKPKDAKRDAQCTRDDLWSLLLGSDQPNADRHDKFIVPARGGDEPGGRGIPWNFKPKEKPAPEPAPAPQFGLR